MTAPRRPATGNQARSDRTRATVIDAAVAYINEEGLAPPSVRRITERAGVTWGGAQYHFGDLDGVLMAVVDKGFHEVVSHLDQLESAIAASAESDRTALVVDTVWRAFSTPTSMAALELLIATRVGRSPAANDHLAAMTSRLAEIGTHLGEGVSAVDSERIANLIWATIRGLVTLQMLWPNPLDTSRDRGMLVDVLDAYLASIAG